MKRWHLAVPVAVAAFVAACSVDTPLPTDNGMRAPGGLRYAISGAVNTDMYNTGDGTCSQVNSNLYPSQFAVGLNGSPSSIATGSYWVQVQTPDGTTLGTSPSANFIADGLTSVCYQVWDLVTKESDDSPGFDETTNPGGEYRLLVSETSAFTPGDGTKSDNFKIRNFIEEPGCEPNCPSGSATFSVLKWYDANADGIQDGAEPLILGWQVELALGAFAGTVSTTYDALSVVDGTEYDATELKPSTGVWIPTTPTNFTGTVTTTNVTVAFGNVCLAGGNGRTLGFWSNKNGQNTMNDGGSVLPELALLNGLPLANATGPQGDFGSYATFRTWLLNGTATNMAYMLSVQLAAMELNVEAGLVSGSSLVYAPDVTASGADGFITISDLMAAAIAALADQETLAGDPNREEQGDIKDALDAANNNTNFVSATPCSIESASWSAWPEV